MSLEQKIVHLRRRLRELKSAVVAFSGGVDSAILVVLAREELGASMCAATASSPSYPFSDKAQVERLCATFDINHFHFETNEFDDPNYVSNPENRCYFCKKALYISLAEEALKKGFKYIVEGTNYSDLNGHRPGYQASLEQGSVVTPLIECQITKPEVREIAKKLNLSVADKPASACLSSRIPTGVRLCSDTLRKIDQAEEMFRSIGILQVRVRHYEDTARIEVNKEQMNILIENSSEIVSFLKALGYKFITLDLAGYRTGGTNL